VSVLEGFESHGIDGSIDGLKLVEKNASFLYRLEQGFLLANGNLISLPYRDKSFDAAIDVVSLQHFNFSHVLVALSESYRVLKFGGSLFSFRLSQGSSMYYEIQSKARWLDEFTVEEIPVGYPLAGNGPTSFWSEEEVKRELTAVGYSSVAITKVSRTDSELQVVEYLAITKIKN
jgi:ubiquinone/menaquinone biosynthesis C-methylase UbiE